jgi:hypothetical protein
MVMRKTGSSADQQVTETDNDTQAPESITKAAAAGGQRELTPTEREEIIRGEEN